ncbi:MAG: DUF1080 domain-containing protein [Planctomycetales bacterium]|nr:DUF1080 domain-containing protein [Planctomycetales bacterium]
MRLYRFNQVTKFALSTLIAVAALALSAQAEEGFVSLFDGKSLDGWDGNPKFWSVQDGAVTGITTADNPTSGNTFILWKNGELKDFVLKVKFRIDGGNSGVQVRSKDLGNWVVGGYQADFDGAGGWTGSFYEERGRGILAKRGNRIEITETGEKKNVGTTTAEKEILDSLAKGDDWNEYVITCKGNHVTFELNGKLTVDLVDNEASKRPEKGILALQLHAGPPMKVQFKDILLKDLN